MSEPAVLGVVLAGGRSSRMGCPKAQVTLGARPLVEHGLALFAAAGIDAAVVTKDLSLLPANTASKHRVLIEDESEIHPLFGVLTALKHANGRPVLALACDMPFVPTAFLKELARRPVESVVAPFDGEFIQPLCALYGPKVYEVLLAAVTAGSSMIKTVMSLAPELISGEELAAFGDPIRIFKDLDTPEDLRLAESWIGNCCSD